MKQSRIVLPEDRQSFQLNLFQLPGQKSVSGLNPFPEVMRTRAGYDQVVGLAQGALGLDFEFNSKTEKPSIVGIAVRKLAAALEWDKTMVRNTIEWCVKTGTKLVGHSVVGADKPVLEKALDIKTPLDLWEDTMIEHYLCHQDFCKSPTKDEDEGSLGFMNLWCMASMTTDAYNWKICRGKACEGPCPKHQVFEYCGIDSWAGIEGHYVMQEELAAHKVPYAFYRDLMEVSQICDTMERRGVRIDIPYIEKLNKLMEENKDKIFSYEVFGKTKVYDVFNPRSNQQILAWFTDHGIPMKTTDIKYVTKVLEKRGQREGIPEFKDYVEFLEECGENISTPTKELFRLWQFKSAGKGTDAWFDPRYRDGDLEHPRFISTGASSGRLASSKPNFQNIPTRGWAVVTLENGEKINRIKAAIIPFDSDCDFVESDFSQLELRDCLWLSGVDPAIAGDDAFTWLVKEAGGLFEKAASKIPSLAAMDPVKGGREAAKSMSHAGDYLEGIEIYTGTDLMKPAIKRQISNGSIRLYTKRYMPDLEKDWEYCGGVVGFTGGNLAMRFFGNKSEEARKAALEIQEDIYFKKFPMIRRWQMKVLAEIEARGFVTSPSGRFLKLYDSPRNNAKVGVAFLGQGVGADHAQSVMLRYSREDNRIPTLVVHDSMLICVNKGWSDKQVFEVAQMMTEETPRFPGFRCPIKTKRGPNYGTLRSLKL